MDPITLPQTLIWDLCVDLLETSKEVLTVNGLALPANTYVSYNAPSWDCCDFLAVYMKSIAVAKAISASGVRRRATLCATNYEATIIVTYGHCVQLGDPIPSPDQINNDAEGFDTISWVLYQGLLCHFAAPSLDGSLGPGCRIIRVGQMDPHGPQGGCATVTIPFTIDLG